MGKEIDVVNVVNVDGDNLAEFTFRGDRRRVYLGEAVYAPPAHMAIFEAKIASKIESLRALLDGSAYVIVSRHPAAVAFIRAEMPETASSPVLATASTDDVRGKIVIGNLPLHLAAHARAVIAVEFDGEAPRGVEYTAEDMRLAGARLRTYTVLGGSTEYCVSGDGGAAIATIDDKFAWMLPPAGASTTDEAAGGRLSLSMLAI